MANLGGILESAKKFYFSLPLITQKGKKEPEIAKAPEKLEAPKIPEAKDQKKQRSLLKKK